MDYISSTAIDAADAVANEHVVHRTDNASMGYGARDAVTICMSHHQFALFSSFLTMCRRGQDFRSHLLPGGGDGAMRTKNEYLAQELARVTERERELEAALTQATRKIAHLETELDKQVQQHTKLVATHHARKRPSTRSQFVQTVISDTVPLSPITDTLVHIEQLVTAFDTAHRVVVDMQRDYLKQVVQTSSNGSNDNEPAADLGGSRDSTTTTTTTTVVQALLHAGVQNRIEEERRVHAQELTLLRRRLKLVCKAFSLVHQHGRAILPNPARIALDKLCVLLKGFT
jgi:hypothetical protein